MKRIGLGKADSIKYLEGIDDWYEIIRNKRFIKIFW
jgi:hypothetical protein